MEDNLENNLIADNSITLAGFADLDDSELESIKGIVADYVNKIKQSAEYSSLKLHMKPIHEKTKGRSHIHFVDAQLILRKGTLGSSASNRNPYTAISEVMDKLLEEIKRKFHKS